MLTTICPTCGAETSARIDPHSFAFPDAAALLGQIHALAASYHWSEDAILDMPSSRRKVYANLIAEGGRR